MHINRQITRLIIAAAVILHAQCSILNSPARAQDWTQVQRLIEARQYASANKQAAALFAQAQKANNAHQMLVGAFYLSQIEHAYQEEPKDSTLARYQRLLPQLRGADRALCLALMDSLPQALKDSTLLQNTAAKDYAEFLTPKPTKGGVDLALTPTLFDVLVWERMNKVTKEEREHLVASLRHLHRHDTCLLVEIELAYADQLTRFDLEEHYRRALEQYGSASCDHYTLLHYRLSDHLRSLGEERYKESIALCDSAVALAPKSEGGLLAQRLKEELLAPKVTLYTLGNDQMSQRHLLTLAQVRNVQRLHFRLSSGEGIIGKEESVLKAKVLKEWTQETRIPQDDPTTHQLYAYLPPMPAGKYVLLASHDGKFSKDHVVWLFLDCNDLVLLPIEGNPTRPEGYLLDRQSGRPIAHQEVTLYIGTGRNQYRDLYTTRTDADGHYSFAQYEQELSQLIQQYKRRPNAKVFYQGRWHGDQQTSYHYGSLESPRMSQGYGLFLDQPLYKPGDTVRFSFLAYRGDGRSVSNAASGERLTAYLYSNRLELLDSLSIELDSFGTAQGFFRLPSDEGIGACYIKIPQYGQEWVRMEHYKQPKFEVLLNDNPTEPAFGLPYRVEGTAAAYSGVPLDGAEVKWSVVRSERYPWWRWREAKSPVCVAKGSLRTDQEGRFAFDFIPTPDSSVELRERPNFIYTITVQVTDLNGETHEAEQSFLLGFDSGELRIDDKRLTFQTLDGKPLEGEVRLRIEELEPVAPRIQPTFDTWGLRNARLDTLRHTLAPEEFAARFPLYLYAQEEPRVRTLVKDTSFTTTGSTPLSAPCSMLNPGRYRLSAYTVGRLGDTIRAEHTLLVGQSDGLLYMKYADGILTLDSRFDSMEVRLLVSVRDSVLSCQRLVLNQETRRIPIAITPEMKGGFRIQALAFKENTLLSHSEEVSVPYKEKQLSLTLTTFRDRLAPGSEEQWTLHVADWKQNPVRANALMTMYDAALDTYDHLNWSLSPWHDNYNSIRFTQPSMSIRNSTGRLYHFPSLNVKSWQAPCWRIARPSVDFLDGMVYCAKAMNSSASREMSVGLSLSDDDAVAEEAETVADRNATFATGGDDTGRDTSTPQLRSNFSTLAFFRPTLRTDSLGNADITFRVPDLLTRWSIHGLAWTKDMCYGSLQEQAVTQKELMVQMNKPRFLRQGDSVMLSAKITNMTDEALCAFVELKCGAEHVGVFCDILAHSSAVATFPLKADSLGLLEYTLTASTPDHSDGERDAIAVLPTRQRVTESMAMYLNGSGEKDYLFSHLLHSDTSATLQHDSLRLEWVNNPMELAVAAFPHLKEQENPSNIYRFNAYYCNRLAERLAIPADPANENLQKLLAAQRPDGGWSWIPGGDESSLWATTYILTGLGRLGEKNQKALAYVDNEEYKFYEKYLKKRSFRCEPDNISYLYMRSYFGHPSGKMKAMYDFYYANAKKHALDYTGLYTRAQLALLFHRTGDKKLARQIVDQLKECALTSDEMGMYWRDNRSGLFWTDRPIEVQALLIEAFRTICPADTESVALMQQWLLKQKQTTRWESDIATANAITALVETGAYPSQSKEGEESACTISIGRHLLDTLPYSTTSIDTSLARVHISRQGRGPAWGAMYWSYYEEMEKIPSFEMGIKLKRTLYRVEQEGTLTETSTFHVGDRMRVRIDIQCDRTLDHLELRDPHAATCEPLSTANGWHWNRGLSYYNYTSNDATILYIDRLQKGKYYVEYDLYLTADGTFALPPCQISSLYAPAFRALAPAFVITVRP